MPKGKSEMKTFMLVMGGCRSGKSRFALDYADRHFRGKVFLATAQALDEEMTQRIRQHREARDARWTTVEEPIDLAGALRGLGQEAEVVLIDCLTLWINNLLMADETGGGVPARVAELNQTILEIPPSVIVVSNEVGTGIVPENRLARMYRDQVGGANQQMAARADIVVYTVAGLPQVIKGALRDEG
jgi:adenosylcobinamide kinase/adenosylcobinamide-phosphate guanylyltransferase